MSKTIEQLEGRSLGDPPPDWESNTVKQGYHLQKKPIDQFSVEDMAFVMRQRIGVEFLMPRALGLLEQNPLVEGQRYGVPAALLLSVLQLPRTYWQQHEDQLRRAVNAARKALDELEARKAKRASKSAFQPGERTDGTDPFEEDIREKVASFLSAHEAA